MAETDESRRTGLILDGQPVEVRAHSDAPLLSVLREDLGRLGVRTGCLEGRCGSCTVLVEDRAVQSCSTPLWSVAGKRIATLQGAAAGSWLDRVRTVFLEEQAAQCGYCVNGIVTTLAALFMAPEPPDRDHILEVLDERHLCRCGAHLRMLRAIDRLLAEARAKPRGEAAA